MGYCSALGQTGRAKEYTSVCADEMLHAKSISQNKYGSVLHDANGL